SVSLEIGTSAPYHEAMDQRQFPKRPIVAVGVLLLDQGRVLLVQRARPPQAGRGTVPGGAVELGETLGEAAAPQPPEETGLSARIGPIVEVLDRVLHSDDGRVEYHYVILDFLATDPTGALQVGDGCADARWVAFDEVARYDTTDGLEPVIRRALEIRD